MYDNSMWTVAGIQVKLWQKRVQSDTVSTGLHPNKSTRLHSIKNHFHWNYTGTSAQEIIFMLLSMLHSALHLVLLLGKVEVSEILLFSIKM